MSLCTHQRTELHYQQVGSDLGALGQTLQQSMMLESTVGWRRWRKTYKHHNKRTAFKMKGHQVKVQLKMFPISMNNCSRY